MKPDKLPIVKRIGSVAFIAVFLLLILMLLGQVLSAKYNIVYYFSDVEPISQVNYRVNGENRGELRLPAKLYNLEPGDEVSLSTTVDARSLNNLLIKTINVKMRFYINDELYYTIGDPGTFPTFQHEPPVSVDSIAMPRTPDTLNLRFEYQLSDIANTLEIPIFYEGDPNLISSLVQSQNALPFFLAISLLVIGLVLTILGLTFYRRAASAIALFWLGLAMMCGGLWTFFANDLTLLLFSQSTLFYNLSYIALFLMPLPLTRFRIVMLRTEKSRIMEVLFWLLCLVFISAIICQMTGVLSFGITKRIFNLTSPIIAIIYNVILLIARFYHHSKVSAMFIVANLVLMVLALVEGANAIYGFLKFNGMLLQIGLLFMAAVVAVMVWEFLVGAFAAAEKNAKLELEVAATNRNLSLQRTLYESFTAAADEIRKSRHDTRHQLLAVRGMITEQKYQEAESYIDKLYSTVPSIADKLICDNAAVNALAVHYLAEAEANGIQCDLRLDVPPVVGRIPDSDLSVIVGNLFENAIEACLHIEDSKRFIKLRGNITKSRFMFTIDNSYDGKLIVRDQQFYSRKRDNKTIGIGIASVKTVVLKYDGSMKYEAQDGIFKTSLYVKI